MMIKKYNVTGNEFEFICEFENTRNGFNHKCSLFNGTICLSNSKCHYINRTWEAFEYQSVMISAIHNIINSITEFEKTRFLMSHNYTKLTKSRKEEFEKLLNENKELNTYNELLKMVRRY